MRLDVFRSEFGVCRLVIRAMNYESIPGPGYRIYYRKRGQTLVLLLCGGDKGTQTTDIAKAKALAKEL
jgi:putative addiction module killer protein